MGLIYDETLRRFPEVAAYTSEDAADLPYCVVTDLADWLLTVATLELPADVIERVKDFQAWCYRQPRDDTAENDAETVFRVSLLEPLFGHDALLPLLPYLLCREDMTRNRDYFVTWVGLDRYKAAMKQPFPRAKTFARRMERGGR